MPPERIFFCITKNVFKIVSSFGFTKIIGTNVNPTDLHRSQNEGHIAQTNSSISYSNKYWAMEQKISNAFSLQIFLFENISFLASIFKNTRIKKLNSNIIRSVLISQYFPVTQFEYLCFFQTLAFRRCHSVNCIYTESS